MGFIETGHRPLLLDYTTWVPGTNGAQPRFNPNGATTENYIITDLDPWGKETAIWEARPDGFNNADGGWNSSSIPIDSSKLYRLSVFVRRTVIGNGRFYFGCYGYNSSVSNIGVYYNSSPGTIRTNPYFHSKSWDHPAGEWILVVGHIWPHNHTDTSNHPDSGYWDLGGKKVGNISYDMRWIPENVRMAHRTYLYYSTDVSTRQQWCYPRVDVCDGTEPSIQDLLNGFDSRYIEYIRSKGGANPIGLDVGDQNTYVGNISEVGPVNGLVAYYPLNGDTRDYSGSGYHGVNNGATVTAGIRGGALSFNQYPNYVDIPYGNGINTSNPLTISLWAKVDNTDGNTVLFAVTNGSNQRLYISKYGSLWEIAVQNQAWNGGVPVTLGSWTHLLLTMDGSSASLYINGVLGRTKTYTPYSLTSNFRIGNHGGSSLASTYQFIGSICDVRIYNRALAEEEIKVLYNATKPDPAPMQISNNGIVYLAGELKEV